MSHSRQEIVGSLIWKFLERGGVQVVQFVVSMIIARLVLPSAYGAVAILMIFISIATVFVQSGLNTALVQKKDADEVDSSSVFYYSVITAAIIYGVLWMSTSWIERFFRVDGLTPLLRVLALILFPGALNSIQLAILTKRMQFKKQFSASNTAAVVSGIVGIAMAYRGYEAWALVAQQLTYQCVTCVILLILLRWYPRFEFSYTRTKVMLSFGLKLLVARLVDTLYHNLENLIIGRQFSAATLAYCNKGKQFPLTLIDNIDGSIQSVMLPAYAAKQDDVSAVKTMLRKTISMSTYIVFPIMTLLAIIGRPMIVILLGPNWLESVPYLQIFCFIVMLFPMQTANLQAINAMGLSSVYLKLMWWKRAVGVVLLFLSVILWYSPFAVIYAAFVIEIIAVFINVPANVKIFGYTLRELWSDIFPNIILSVFVGLCCLTVNVVTTIASVLLVGQVLVWCVAYVAVSKLLRNSNWDYLMLLVTRRKS